MDSVTRNTLTHIWVSRKPAYKLPGRLRFRAIMSKRKTHKASRRLRVILAANLAAKMKAAYRDAKSENARIMRLREKTGGVGKETIRRLLRPKNDEFDPSLGTIEAIAMALRCEVYELLEEPGSESATA